MASVMITAIRGSILQGHKAFSEHSRGRQRAFVTCSVLTLDQRKIACASKFSCILSIGVKVYAVSR